MPPQRNLRIPLVISLIGLFVWAAACQPLLTPLPGPTPQPLARTKTQSPTKTSANPALDPKQETPTFLPTRPGHLQLDPSKLKGAVIQFWHPFGGEEELIINDIVSDFNKNNEWGIRVESFGLGSSGLLFSQIENTIGENELPNVIAAPVQQLQIWQENNNIIINLNDYLNDPDWGLMPVELADIPLGFLKQDQVSDRLLGIPAQRTAQVILYNQSWAEELGIRALPSAPQDFEQQACAAAKANLADDLKENDGTGGWIINTDAETMLAWMTAFGLENPGDFGAEGYSFNNQRFRDGFNFFKELYDKGCAWAGRSPTPYDYFANRYTLFYSGTLEDVVAQQNAMQHFNSQDRWIILPYPGSGQKPSILTSGPSYAVLVDTPEKQLASWLLIRWLMNPENQATLAESSGAWPASVTALESLTAYRQKYPQWASSLPWIPIAQPIPRLSSWVTVRSIFSDAAWQVFQTNTPPENIPTILRELDRTVQEVLKR